MAVRGIVKWPDTRLTTVCTLVQSGDDLGPLIHDMFETMYHATGRGLAAPQVGHLTRLFVMDSSWKSGERGPIACINPKIVERSADLGFVDEECLSIPGILVSVQRPIWIVLEWIDGEGAPQRETLQGDLARIAQHELDHLDGITTFQRIDKTARALAEAEYSAL